MNAPLSPEVAELIERTAENFELVLDGLHLSAQHRASFEVCTNGVCPGVRQNIAELRALLPQPEPTCPNCPDPVDGHDLDGCLVEDCDCAFSPAAIPQVRALLAVGKDTTPAQRPRVWKDGDPEPEGVERVWDAGGDEWHRLDDGWHRHHEASDAELAAIRARAAEGSDTGE